METRAFYRKFRSQTFADILGQEHVTRTLLRALQTGRVAHAYLFAGPRGTGKTSTARILAKAVNCLTTGGNGEPCNHCPMCTAINEGRALDLIEIDAASNRGIDEIRDLRDKVNFAPTQARYKVYIIDEVHMLTTEAFNALLKTLEEPPAHTIFVLATTEVHKIPATILSRCQRFDFHRAPLPAIVAKLRHITDNEGLRASSEALELIARTATGSFRDAESLLDQLASIGGDEGITVDLVQSILGLAPSAAVADLVDAILATDTTAGLRLINNVADGGADLRHFTHEIVDYLRSLMLIKTNNAALVHTSDDLLQRMTGQAQKISLTDLAHLARLFANADASLRTATNPQMILELAVVDACTPLAPQPTMTLPAQEAGTRSSPSPAARPTPTAAGPERPASTPHPPSPSTGPVTRPTMATAGPPRPASEGKPPELPTLHVEATPESLRMHWPDVIKTVNTRNRVIAGLLRDAHPTSVSQGIVTIGVYDTFHKERLQQPASTTLLEEVFSQALGSPYRIRVEMTQRPSRVMTPEERKRAAAEHPVGKHIIDAFNAEIVAADEPVDNEGAEGPGQ